jgi:hypothetical protein
MFEEEISPEEMFRQFFGGGFGGGGGGFGGPYGRQRFPKVTPSKATYSTYGNVQAGTRSRWIAATTSATSS